MKRVLIIGYLHPFARSGGSFRTLPLAKYLPEFGWEPIVLTPSLLEKEDLPFRVIETPYRDALGFWKKLFGFDLDRDIKRQVKERFGVTSKKSLIDFILTRGGAIINYPDSHRGWKPFALKAGNEIMQQENIDAIISCHPVATSHIIASTLKAKYGIPWVADFADLWSQNPHYGYGPVRKLLDTRLELKTLSKADALVTVSEPWAKSLRTLHRGKTVYAITHGFDLTEVNNPPANLMAKFTITYTGTIYTGKHDPSKLFAALQHLILNGTMDPDDIKVRFYGHKNAWLDKEIEHYGLSSIVAQYGLVSRDVAVEKQRESQLLLRLKLEKPQERGAYSGKIFEYLAARRPILATGGSVDVVSELLDETKAGICALTVEDIENALKELYREFKLKGEIAYKGEESELNKYTHQEMSRRFSEILDHLAQNDRR
ncbi:hypothetical protein ES703_18526 [subsurface metagenome]